MRYGLAKLLTCRLALLDWTLTWVGCRDKKAFPITECCKCWIWVYIGYAVQFFNYSHPHSLPNEAPYSHPTSNPHPYPNLYTNTQPCTTNSISAYSPLNSHSTPLIVFPTYFSPFVFPSLSFYIIDSFLYIVVLIQLSSFLGCFYP